MTRLLVNNTEQVQPQDRDDTLIKLFCRGAENPDERVEITVMGFKPYLHAPAEETEEQETELLNQQSVDRIDYVDHDVFADADASAARIYTKKPQHVTEIAEYFSETWDSDVPFTRRFRIDTGIRDIIEIPDGVAESGSATLHWREIEPVVPPSSTPGPGGSTGKGGGAE